MERFYCVIGKITLSEYSEDHRHYAILNGFKNRIYYDPKNINIQTGSLVCVHVKNDNIWIKKTI